MRRSTRSLLWALPLAATALLVGCTPGPNPLAHHAIAGGDQAGFFLGLWHGVIIWVSFIVSLFDRGVSVYEVHNSGWAYDLGFTIGAASMHGGGVAAARRRRPPKERADPTATSRSG